MPKAAASSLSCEFGENGHDDPSPVIQTMTDVTISIVHASGPELTLECIQSLEADRARRCTVEIVVLDNASGDFFAHRVRQRFPDVRLIDQAWRSGFGANQNEIIRSTESRYVFVLNPDTQVPGGTVDGLVDYLDTHPTVGVVGPLIRGFDGIQQGSAWRLVSVPVQLAWALTIGRLGAVVAPRHEPRRVGAVSACAMLVRREALEAVGLFDEAYFMFNEEADLARRLDRVGLECHYTFEVRGTASRSEIDSRCARAAGQRGLELVRPLPGALPLAACRKRSTLAYRVWLRVGRRGSGGGASSTGTLYSLECLVRESGRLQAPRPQCFSRHAQAGPARPCDRLESCPGRGTFVFAPPVVWRPMQVEVATAQELYLELHGRSMTIAAGPPMAMPRVHALRSERNAQGFRHPAPAGSIRHPAARFP